MQIFTNANYDFIRWRWHALILSAILVLAGIGYGVIRGGIPLGIDFTGGTLIVVRFSQPVAEDAVRKALDGLPGEKVVQKYGERRRQRDPDPPAAGHRRRKRVQPGAGIPGGHDCS